MDNNELHSSQDLFDSSAEHIKDENCAMLEYYLICKPSTYGYLHNVECNARNKA